MNPPDQSAWARLHSSIQEVMQLALHPTTLAPLPDSTFNALALDSFRLQYLHNLPYQKLCRHRGVSPDSLSHWTSIPHVPTAAFKDFEWTCLSPSERIAVFHSSGTTQQRPSRHFHGTRSLELYEHSLRCAFEAFRHTLCSTVNSVSSPPPPDPTCLIALTPPRDQAPHSSLVHMFDSLMVTYGASDSFFAGAAKAPGDWSVDTQRVAESLKEAQQSGRPVWLMGTAFNWVHLLDALASLNQAFQLPVGSMAMETGGYKGRSRTLTRQELHELIHKQLELDPKCIVTEYGMSELSSQAYSLSQVGIVPRHSSNRPHLSWNRPLHFPVWARLRIVSPESGREVADGETGMVHVMDLANLYSVSAIATEDLAIRRGAGFDLIGRANQAEPRGCSLMSPTDSIAST